MSIIKEGWTEKCGPKRCPTWNKRWLVLYDTRVLEYFVNDTKTELKGQIELSGKETIKLSGDSGKNYDNGFYLETNSRTYKFAVSSMTEKTEWCDLIKQVIDGDIRRNKSKNNTKLRTTSTFHKRLHKEYSKSNGNSPKILNKRRAQSSPITNNMKCIEAMTSKSCNYNLALFRNDSILIRIIDFLYMDKHEFGKLFVICKVFREICINNGYFFRYYSINVYPRHILDRFCARRKASNAWILNHDYREIWIFGSVCAYNYNKELSLSPYFGPVTCNKLFLDDPLLWDCDSAQLEEIVRYISDISLNIRFIHIRSYTSDSIFIQSLPSMPLIDCVRLDFTFHQELLAHKLDTHNLIYLELHRVDLISDCTLDTSFNEHSLRMCFKQLTKLLVLSIIDSRWKHCIVLPPQIKMFRFRPSDLSIVDMSRIADKSQSTQNNLSYKVNWPCDMIVNHSVWPSVMNQYIMAGHQALQNKKLRIWVLRHLRKWDNVLMNVNYCQYPPPLQLFKKAKCFKRLTQLDNTRDMSHIWTSKKSKYWRHEKP